MKDLIKMVIQEVHAGKSPDLQETLLRAMLLFEKFYHSGDWHGIESEVEDAVVSEESINELREAVMAFAQANREHKDAGSALHALGKCWGCPLRKFFLTEMKIHFDAGRQFPLSQAEAALFHFGGGTHYDYPPGVTGHPGYHEACRKFLENNL
jgi:hypothetical protein